MGCSTCGSTFRRKGFDSGRMTKVSNGSLYRLATYSDCSRTYAASHEHSKKTVMIVARGSSEHERLFSDRTEAARYKRQLQRQGIPNKIARVSAVYARDLCYDAVVELFEESVVQEKVTSQAVQ